MRHLVIQRLRVRELVEAFHDALINSLRLLRHGHVLIVGCDVVDHIFVLAPHFFHTILYDGRHLKAKGRIVALHGRASECDEERMPIL